MEEQISKGESRTNDLLAKIDESIVTISASLKSVLISEAPTEEERAAEATDLNSRLRGILDQLEDLYKRISL